MEKFTQFLIDYKELIISFLTLFLTIVCIFVKRKPKTLDDFILAISDVLSVVPSLVSSVEEPKNGSLKKEKVINMCIQMVSHRLHRSLSSSEISLISSKVSSQIEDVLSTPCKKC